VVVVVAGKLNDARFQKAKIAAQSLQEFHAAEGVSCEIKAMVPCEWELFLEAKTRELGGVVLTKNHKAPPLVYLETPEGPGEYIGGLEEFMAWANDKYGYVDNTKDLIYNAKAKTEYKKYKKETGRTYVFLDFTDEFSAYDRVVIELFNDIAPLTAENFRCLCTGERGDKLHYKGHPVHRVVKGGWLQAGDIEPPHSGAGGFSIYGGTFADESFAYPHDMAGVLGMANQGFCHITIPYYYFRHGHVFGIDVCSIVAHTRPAHKCIPVLHHTESITNLEPQVCCLWACGRRDADTENA